MTYCKQKLPDEFLNVTEVEKELTYNREHERIARLKRVSQEMQCARVRQLKMERSR